MPSWRNDAPRLLLVGGLVFLLVAGVLVATLWSSRRTGRTAPTTPAPATTVSTTVPEPSTAAATTTTQPPAAPSPVAMSWNNAGGIVWHLGAVDPTLLGQQMRTAGFGWVAVYLGGNDATSPPDPSWISRFRTASGLPVGGWSVLGVDPAQDAAQAAQLIGQDALAFYIADAEQPYGYTEGATYSPARFDRSRLFVSAFRAAEPDLPAALSSYCRPDQHDLDWAAWAHAGFAFLPQAYVNALGNAVSPATCTRAAAAHFPASQVHPTVGSYSGRLGIVDPPRLARLLAQAGTTGFSIYPAEVGMDQQNWQTYGQAITSLRIANRVR